MALGGIEQIMVALLGKMGIDSEMVKSVAEKTQETTQRINAGLDAQANATLVIQAKLDRMEQVLNLILEHVEPKPDGGYVLGTGHEDDVVSEEKDLTHLGMFPPGKTWR